MIRAIKKLAPIRFYITHFHPHVTWGNILTTKMIVVGLAGLKLLLGKTIVNATLLIGAILNLAPLFSTASVTFNDLTKSPYGLCGNGIQEYGELCDGKVSCELPCMCQDHFYRCGKSCIPTTLGCKGGEPISLTTPEANVEIDECTNGEQRICDTFQESPCAGGSQKCIDGSRTACTPLNKTREICDDNIDNDCDLKIDAADPECGIIQVEGCTNPNACNYDPEAERDNGLCVLPKGCNKWCPGDEGAPQKLDACNQCGGDGSTCKDCKGEPYGQAVLDACGQCLSPEDPNFDVCQQEIPLPTAQIQQAQEIPESTPENIEVHISQEQGEDYLECIQDNGDFATCRTALERSEDIVSISIAIEDLLCELSEMDDSPHCGATTFETSSNKRNITNTKAHTFLLKCLERFKNAEYCAEIMLENNLDPTMQGQ